MYFCYKACPFVALSVSVPIQLHSVLQAIKLSVRMFTNAAHTCKMCLSVKIF